MKSNDAPDIVETWVLADGDEAAEIRRSLIDWAERADVKTESQYFAAVVALIDFARGCAESHPKDRDRLAELFYRAGDQLGAPDDG